MNNGNWLYKRWFTLKKWMRHQLSTNSVWSKIGWIIAFCFYLVLLFFLLIALLRVSSKLFPETIRVNSKDNIILIESSAIAALLGSVFLVIQLRRENVIDYQQNLIKQCEFLKEYNQFFIENEAIDEIERRLEQYFLEFRKRRKGEKNDEAKIRGEIRGEWELVGSENRQKLINYLVFLEGFSTAVLNYSMTLDVVDSLFAYRYFVAVNNPVVQEIELTTFSQYYQGIFKLYQVWIKYYTEKCRRGDYCQYDVSNGYLGIPMHCENYALCENEQFLKINQIKVQKCKWEAKTCFDETKKYWTSDFIIEVNDEIRNIAARTQKCSKLCEILFE